MKNYPAKEIDPTLELELPDEPSPESSLSPEQQARLEQRRRERIKDTQDSRQLREKSWNLFADLVDIVDQENAEHIDFFNVCGNKIKQVLFDNPADSDLELKNKIRPEIYTFAKRAITYFKKEYHCIKNFFRVFDLDMERVIAFLPGKKAPRLATRTDSKELPKEDITRYTEIQKAIDTIRSDKNMLAALYKNHMSGRYRTVGVSESDIAAYGKELIKKITELMTVYLIKDAVYLVPGTDTLTHARRNMRKKRTYDDVPFALWIGGKFLHALLSQENGLQDFALLMLEEAQHFDIGDAGKHQKLHEKYDFKQFVDHDDVFWNRMQKFAHTIEPIELHEAPDPVDERIRTVFKKALDIPNGESVTLWYFRQKCRDLLYPVVQRYGHETNEQLVERFWPMLLKKADEVLATEDRENHPIKNIYLIWEIKNEQVRRTLPDNTTMVPTLANGGRDMTTDEEQEWQDVTDFINNTRKNTALFRKVFDAHMRQKYENIGCTEKEIEWYFQMFLDMLQKNTTIDIIRGKTWALPAIPIITTKGETSEKVTTAKARGGYDKKHSYQGHAFGMWMGENFVRTLMTAADAGMEYFAWIMLEEAQHFNRGKGMIGHGAKEGWGEFEKYGDHEMYAKHGYVFQARTTVIGQFIEKADLLVSEFSGKLRTIQDSSSNPILQSLQLATNTLLNSSIFDDLDTIGITKEMVMSKIAPLLNETYAKLTHNLSPKESQEYLKYVGSVLSGYSKNVVLHKTQTFLKSALWEQEAQKNCLDPGEKHAFYKKIDTPINRFLEANKDLTYNELIEKGLREIKL